MTTNPNAESSSADRELVFTRVFDAPRRLVFDAWTKKEHLDRWLMPLDFTIANSGGDLRPGGDWWCVMHAPDGEEYAVGGVYREIVPDERLTFTHAWKGDDGLPEHETLITVQLADEPGGKTRMTFTQAFFKSVESRDRHAGGWTESFDHLAEYAMRLG